MKTFKLAVTLVLTVITLFGLSSCNTEKREVEETVTEFFQALQCNDTVSMRTYYQNIDSLSNFYKSDSIVILKTEKSESGEYCVEVKNMYEDDEFETQSTNITLNLTRKSQEDPNSGFVITSSIGLIDFDQLEITDFARKVGCFDDYFPQSDYETLSRVRDSKNLRIQYLIGINHSLYQKIKLIDYVDVGRTPGYVEVTGRLGNYSAFRLKNIYYKLSFYENYYTSQEVEGYLFPDGIAPNTEKVFTIRTDYIGLKSRKMFIDVWPKDHLEYCLEQIPFKGNEYRKYLRDNNKE